MKTYLAKKGDVAQKWLVADLDGKVLGRAAASIARILMGKHRPTYTAHVDTGDFVVVVNVEKVRVTGNKKPEQRVTRTYSHYPGGQKVYPLKEMLVKHPDRIFRDAVRRMLPKTTMGDAMLTKLKVYKGPTHRHQAQNPQKIDL
jgi:large subunit ribosomal protein L13